MLPIGVEDGELTNESIENELKERNRERHWSKSNSVRQER